MMDGPGILYGDTFTSNDETLVRVAKAATGFHALGVRKDDTVAVMLRNDPAYLEATLGIRVVGAMPVPINWHLQGAEIAYILEDSGAKVFVVHSDLFTPIKNSIPDSVQVVQVETPDLLRDIYEVDATPVTGIGPIWDEWLDSHEPWAEEPAMQTASMIYTSGTTGRPKGVRREPATPEQYAEQVEVVAGVLGVVPGCRTIVPAPMYHAAPNAYSIYAVQLKTSMVIMPRFDAEEFLRIIQDEKITHIQMVPTMFVRLLKLPEDVRNKYDVSSLEYIIHAAAPCPPQIKQSMIDWWGPIIWEYYGSTEMSAVTLCSAEEALKYPGTVGRKLDRSLVKIYDDDGNELPANEIGHVYGNLLTNTDFTYQNDDAKRAGMERDGLLSCGDIGYLNDEGFLFLCDRASNMIISGGANIYPAEIESALIEMEGVKDCAVFGIPDADFGEKVAAIIELEDDANIEADAIAEFLRDRIAGYKVPRHIEFRDNLPREDSGKLFKRKLKDEFWKDTGRSI
jgi:long-chain acyl-CoA synthetase